MKKEDRKKIGFLISILLLIGIGIFVRGSSNGILFDELILKGLSKIDSKSLDFIMKAFTSLGSAHFFIPIGFILVVYFIYKMEKRNGWLIINSIAVSYTINAILKMVFIRTRPIDYMRIDQSGYSYPSGHSMVSMSFYMTVGYILSEKIEDENLKKLVRVVFTLLGIIIGFSRNYLGVHWPTDVIMGLIMGYWVYDIGKSYIKF